MSRWRSLALMVAGVTMLSSLGARGAHAQGLYAANNRMFGEHNEDFARRGDRDDDNPTGMGKPGVYWSLPTGTRIYRHGTPSDTKVKSHGVSQAVAGGQGGAAAVAPPK